jgi:hypothetical protein
MDDATAAMRAEVAEEQEGIERRLMDAYTASMAEMRKLADTVRKVELVVKVDETEIPLPAELRHESFAPVYRLAAMGLDVFLHGPAGVGKTHMCRQIAAALPRTGGGVGRRFGFITGSPGVTERHFTGTATPNITTGTSVFNSTEFIECYEKGGVFLIDEGDAMDPTVWVSLNAALANGRLSLPLRSEKPEAERHADFVLIVSANTTGTGGDRAYTARYKLDASTIDRFAGCCVPMGYSPTIERALCPDQKLYNTLTGWRAAIAAAGLERILSTRFLMRAAKFAAAGETLQGIAQKLTRDAGWGRDEADAVIGRQLAEAVYADD